MSLHHNPSSPRSLQLVQTVFRHGDRVPEAGVYPNDPYNESDWAPIPSGGLTNRGKERSLELGRFFRRRYGSSLRGVDDVKFFCSIVPRTQVTAQLVGTGLFSESEERWSESLQLQDIPINMPSSLQESWYYFCSIGLMGSAFEEEEKLALDTSPELLKYLDDNRSFFEHISRHAGISGTYDLPARLYSVLQPELELGLKLPSWTEPIFAKLKAEAPMTYVIRGSTNGLKKFGGGLWLKIWLDNIDALLAGKLTEKMIFWSAHDVNVADLLVALENFEDPHVPLYNSAVILELHKIDGRYFVKLLYKREEEAEELRISGCPDGLCPLETFRMHFADILPPKVSPEICERKPRP